MKSGRKHKANYVKYMATRDGAELVKSENRYLDATDKQKELINGLIKDFPDAKDSFEYDDFLKYPTRENASSLISSIMDLNLEAILTRKNYVDYIANRPRVERIEENGMFTDQDGIVNLQELSQEVGNHAGNIWTHIISVRREDAVRLGYDHAKSWMDLCRAKRNEIAKEMNIKPENLRWYAAYHDEGHHPHIHMICFSNDHREGYVTKESITHMRSSFANEIFKDDLLNLYKTQTVLRDNIKQVSKERIEELIQNISVPIIESKKLQNLFSELKDYLSDYNGRKFYAYIPKSAKAIVDQIVDELSNDENVKELIEIWYEKKDDVYRTYRDNIPEHMSLSRIPDFKSIKNMILKFVFEENYINTQEMDINIEQVSSEINRDIIYDYHDISLTEQIEYENISIDPPSKDIYCMEWNDEYKLALKYLYGSDDEEKDIKKAIELLKKESERNNVLALYDMGNLYDRGIGFDQDDEASTELFKKAFQGFHSLLDDKKRYEYINYRIGKMYLYGQGTEIDYAKALIHFKEAEHNIYAQYNLGCMFNRGLGVTVDYNTAYAYFMKSSENPYSSYAGAELLDNKKVVSNQNHDILYGQAYRGFIELEKQSHDDNLQYRLGKMLYLGKGVEQNIEESLKFLEQSASMENKNAKYLLSKIYLEQNLIDKIPIALQWLEELSEENKQASSLLAQTYKKGVHVPQNLEKAIKYYKIAADQNDVYAQYQLAKLYLDYSEVFNQQQGIDYLTMSAKQKLDFAQYRLGKYYLNGDMLEKNIEQAVFWMREAAQLNNQFAQLALGKLFLFGTEVEKDIDKAIYYLQASAVQGNIYAQYFLDHMDDTYSPAFALLTSRLFHHVSNIFQQQLLPDPNNPLLNVDSKLRKKLLQKKSALGHKIGNQSNTGISTLS